MAFKRTNGKTEGRCKLILSEKKKVVKSSNDIVIIVRSILSAEHVTDQSKEHFWVIGLSNKAVIQFIELVSLGTLNTTLVHPREVFRFSIMKACASIILAHNHPGDCPRPSTDDLIVTERLVKAGEIVGIQVLDHVIVCEFSYYSFKNEGKIS